MNSATASANGNARMRIRSRWMPCCSSTASDSAIGAPVEPYQMTPALVGCAARSITGAGT